MHSVDALVCKMDKRVSLWSRLDERSQRAQGLQSNVKEMSGGGSRQSRTSPSPTTQSLGREVLKCQGLGACGRGRDGVQQRHPGSTG